MSLILANANNIVD